MLNQLKLPPMCPIKWMSSLVRLTVYRKVVPFMRSKSGQRRRWLNGSFFAAVHATIMFHRIWTSGHNIFRKLWLTIEFLYNAINLFFTWTALANFYLALFFVFQASISVPTQDPFGGQGDDVTQITTNVYVGLLFVILVCSLGNRPSGSKFAYTTVIVSHRSLLEIRSFDSKRQILFAAIFGIALYCAAWTIYLAVCYCDLFQESRTIMRIDHRYLIPPLDGNISPHYLNKVVLEILSFPWELLTVYTLLPPSFTPSLGTCLHVSFSIW